MDDFFGFRGPWSGRRNDDERMDGVPFRGPSLFFGDPFGHVGQVFRETEELMKQFDEVFENGFDMPDYALPIDDYAVEGRPREYASPRDRMLRAPGDSGSKVSKRDFDYDDLVAEKGLASVMKSKERHPHPGFFAFRSNVVQKQNLGDGRVKEFRSYTDSEGNKHEVTRKMIGEKEYVITNKITPTGEQQKTEEFHGMEEGDLPEFESQFAGNRGNRMIEMEPSRYADGRSLDIREKRPWRSYIIHNLHKWF